MNPPKAWQAALQLVQRLQSLHTQHQQQQQHQHNQEQQEAVVDKMEDLYDQIQHTLGVVPEHRSSVSECKQVVLKLKVPYHLAQACNVDLTGPVSVAFLSAVLNTIQNLLSWATANDFFPLDGVTGALVPAAQQGRVALGHSVTQQLQEAGLPQQLMKLMTYVTQQLPTSQEAFAAAVDEISNRKTTGRGLRWASSSNILIDDDEFASSSSSSSIDLAGLLTMSQVLVMTQQGVIGTADASLSAADVSVGVELVFASLRQNDWHLQHLQEQQQQQGLPGSTGRYQHFEDFDYVYMDGWTLYLHTLLLLYPHLQPVVLALAMPSATNNMGFLAQVLVYRNALRKLQLPAPGANSSRSSSSSGTSKSAKQGRSNGQKKGRNSSSGSGSSSGSSAISEVAVLQWAFGVAVTRHEQMPYPAPATSERLGLSKLMLTWVAAATLHSGILEGIELPPLLEYWNKICRCRNATTSQ